MSDRDLVARARQGDSEAFTQLIMQYQVPLFNMALRMVGEREDAADIVQEAFVRAWEKIRTLRDAPFKSWLFQILENVVQRWQTYADLFGKICPNLLFTISASITSFVAPKTVL